MGISREYPATKWISVNLNESDNGCGLGLVEVEDFVATEQNLVRIDLFVNDLDSYWQQIAYKVTHIHPPEETPWGSYKAVFQDPFGHHIGIVERPSA
jgi:uncharacterized glyoxalase superfamily protein PhnB